MPTESVEASPKGHFTPTTKAFAAAKAESQRVRRSTRRSLAQASDLKDLAFAHIQDLREKFASFPATTRGELRQDSATFISAIRTWQLMHEQVERIRKVKQKKSAGQDDDKRKVPEILNAPPEFPVPTEQS